jgi:hypothetical protein
MGVDLVSVNSALVFRDSAFRHRWYDAFGSGVVKQIEDFATIASDDSTGDPTEWEVTVVEAGAGDSTAVVTDRVGGALLITSAANEDDGWSMQLGATAGESVKLDGNYPLYCGIRLAINDVDQTDFLFGVAVTDTAILGGVTDGMYFRSVDATAVVNFVTEKNSVESETAVATMVDDTYVTLEFLFDGVGVTAYADGVEITSTAAIGATFPNDEELRLSLEFLTGEAVANTCTVEWLRMVYVR